MPSTMEQSQVGQRRPLHSTATGKLFLAFGGVPVADLTLKSRAPNTITDKAILEEEIERVRHCGYATAVDEEQIGVAGVSVPIFDKTGEIVASLGASTDTSRYAEEFEKMVNELRSVGNGISSMSALTASSG